MRKAKLAEVDLDYVLGVGGFDLQRLVVRTYYIIVTAHARLRIVSMNNYCFCRLFVVLGFSSLIWNGTEFSGS